MKMSQLSNRCWLIVWITLAVVVPAEETSAEVPQGNRPGLVREKPASGRFVKTDQGFMVPYRQTIPGTEISFEMVPIPAGNFLMGSPESEENRVADEGPQGKVSVAAFWMSKHEVTWGEYHVFMDLYARLKQIQGLRYLLSDNEQIDLEGKSPQQVKEIKTALARQETARRALRVQLESPQLKALRKHLERQPEDVDAITAPTELYEPDITYEYGSDADQPAVTMTQYAAKQYSKWLSKLTGIFYRLPSEAEWEYACRAGTATAYHFGDDVSLLGQYAWYADNSDEVLHTVGTKKSNPWGLYDMYGNVAEWVLDAHDPAGYPTEKKGLSKDRIAWPLESFPRAIRGGSWESGAAECRSASRLGSRDEEWKEEDPNLPKSPWWFTTDPARGIGFRLVAPLTVPAAEAKSKFWEIDVDAVRWDVEDRLQEGRGVKDNIHRGLPAVIRQLDKIKTDAKE